MARITRKQQKIFAESATNNGVFGSLQENNPTYSNDPDTIQGRPAYAQGWNGATYSSELLPPLEEFQALQYLFSRQIAYLLQDGVAEWNTATPYYKGSIVKTISGTNIKLFRSLADNNTGNQTTDTSKWALIYDSQNPYANSNFDNITDFSKNISNWSTNTTNCITEIPQDINLELSSGTLTLKAGSKVYMPNGSGVFDVVTNSNDLTYTLTANGEHLVCVAYNASAITSRPVSSCTSGAGATAVSGFAYNTTTNKINNYSGTGTIGGQYTFPIAIITVSNGAISSIDKVFNGFGYIGSSVFALPGIKGLRPDGRNSDGTLKNVYWTCSSVVVRTFPVNENFPGASLLFNGSAFFRLSSGAYSYNQKENYNYSVNDRYYVTIIGSLDETAGVVSNFNTNPAFHAVDYSEFKQADDNNVKITGNQTIDGTKTFNTNVYMNTSGTSGRFYSKNTALDLTNTSRANDIGIGFRSVDKNDNIAGEFTNVFTTAGTSSAVMQVRNRASGSQVTAQINVSIDKNGNISTSCPTPSDTTSTSSTKIATTGWVNTAGNNVVHRSSDETIAGIKTFTDGAFIKKAEPLFGLANTSITKGTAPSAASAEILAVAYDKNGTLQANKLGQIYVQQNTNGGQQITMSCFEPTSGSTTSQGITVGYDGSKKVYTYAPTPSSATDNSTKIATTAWVNNFLEAAATKATITGYCVPNYGSAVTITSPYTPAKNGIIIAKSTSSYSTCEIAKGTTTISRANCADATSSTNAVWAIVKSGEQYTVTATGTATLLFVPFVGG